MRASYLTMGGQNHVPRTVNAGDNRLAPFTISDGAYGALDRGCLLA
jgi:hypothetical protein